MPHWTVMRSIIVWFGSSNQKNRKRLQKAVRNPDKIIAANLPSIEDFIPLQSDETGRKHHSRPITPWTQPVPTLKTLYANTTRHKTGFFLQPAILCTLKSIIQCNNPLIQNYSLSSSVLKCSSFNKYI